MTTLKGMRGVVAVLIALIVMGTAPVFATGNVSYEGESKGFVLEPGSTASKTDIFPNFKEVMPGDTVTDTITVKNSSSDEVKIYMRALDPEKDGADLLSKVKLTVNAKDTGKIFEAAADQKSGLADWVLLGTFSAGGSTTLDLTLDVPIDLGNDYQDSIGYVNWQFQAEDMSEDDPDDNDDPADDTDDEPTDDTDDPSDKDDSTGKGGTATNDPTNFVPWIIAVLAAIAVLVALFIKRRNK